MFGRICVACAEQNGKDSQNSRHRQRNIAKNKRGWVKSRAVMLHHQPDAARNGFELQRNIRNGADGCDTGSKRGHAKALAIASGQKISDGGDVF